MRNQAARHAATVVCYSMLHPREAEWPMTPKGMPDRASAPDGMPA